MLELKSVKYSDFASQETFCYQANLYFRGKKVASVENEGHGGPDMQHWVSPEARDEVVAYVNDKYNTYKTNAEKVAEIRRRIPRLEDLGDACCSRVQLQDSNEKLLEEMSWVLDQDWMNTDIEGICCNLMNEWLQKKELKKLMAKRVLYTRHDNEDAIYQTKCARNKAQVEKWAGQVSEWETTNQVLNNLDFDHALCIFLERT